MALSTPFTARLKVLKKSLANVDFKCPSRMRAALEILREEERVARLLDALRERRLAEAARLIDELLHDPPSLNGLSAETAVRLAELKGALQIDGLTTLSAEAARALAVHRVGGLFLNGLTSLSPEVAHALAALRGKHLFLSGPFPLSGEAAQALSAYRGGRLSLNGLTTLSVEVARALAAYQGGGLSLNGLTALSVETAQALAACQGGLALNGLTTLSEEAAGALAAHRGGRLSLNGLTNLSEEAMLALAAHPSLRLHLNSLTTLSAEAARELAAARERLSLDGLTVLSEEVARELAAARGRLSLDGLTVLSEEVARELAASRGCLSLNGLTALSAEAARELAASRARLSLNGLTALSEEAARELAASRGCLSLNGLTTLSAEAARKFAASLARLSLNGLTTLSEEAARAIVMHRGNLWLKELLPLSPDAALLQAAAGSAVSGENPPVASAELPGLCWGSLAQISPGDEGRSAPLRELLRSSRILFYPAAGSDISPALRFLYTGLVDTMVYCDNQSSGRDCLEKFDQALRSGSGGSVRYVRRQLETVVLPESGPEHREGFFPNPGPLRSPKGGETGPETGVCAVYEDEAGGAAPVRFYYLQTEAIRTYTRLWGAAGLAPFIVVLQVHSGLDILSGTGLLCASAPRLPDFLYLGDGCSRPWPGYREVSGKVVDRFSFYRSRRSLWECVIPDRRNRYFRHRHFRRRNF